MEIRFDSYANKTNLHSYPRFRNEARSKSKVDDTRYRIVRKVDLVRKRKNAFFNFSLYLSVKKKIRRKKRGENTLEIERYDRFITSSCPRLPKRGHKFPVVDILVVSPYFQSLRKLFDKQYFGIVWLASEISVLPQKCRFLYHLLGGFRSTNTSSWARNGKYHLMSKWSNRLELKGAVSI